LCAYPPFCVPPPVALREYTYPQVLYMAISALEYQREQRQHPARLAALHLAGMRLVLSSALAAKGPAKKASKALDDLIEHLFNLGERPQSPKFSEAKLRMMFGSRWEQYKHLLEED